MKIKTLFPLILGCLLTIPLSGQPSFNKQTISNAGEKSTFTGGSFTWTLGEMSVGTVSGTDFAFLQGYAPTMLTVAEPPTPPVVGTITQPTCTEATGSVELTGLPASGTWILTRSPGVSTVTGTGTSKLIEGLPSGTYTYTVTDESSLTSGPSTDIVIDPQPSTPTAPTIGTITPPTCTVATGSVTLNGLPASGTWTITRSPGGTTNIGSGASTTISGLASGTYTFTVTNSSGCISPSSSNAVIDPQPSTPAAPTIGTITQPTCTVATGSVSLNGLPATGTWTITRSPGGTTTNESGTSTTISGLASGTYTFTVTNSSGCISPSSSNAVIDPQPSIPTAPAIGTITQPDCATPTASVVLNGLPSAGTWTLTRSPGSVTTDGTGTSKTISGLAPGTYNYTVTNASGCTSASSSDIVINTVAGAPPAPVIGTITQLTCTVLTGSVELTGLPAAGSWTITASPGGNMTNGSGTSTTISGLAEGTYTFTVTNDAGCNSPPSGNAVINAQPAAPSTPVTGTITQPDCSVSTGSVDLSGLPATGYWTVTRSPGAVSTAGSGTTITVADLPAGTFTFTVTNSSGCVSASSGNVVINTQPSVPTAPVIGTITQPTCSTATGSVELSGLPATGTWTLIRQPSSVTSNSTGTSATVSDLAAGTYTFTITGSSGCVSPSSDNVLINTQPVTPGAPVIENITHPTCSSSTGSVELSGLPASGSWTVTRYPGEVEATGSGISKVISNIEPGTSNFTVTNSTGCTSTLSANALVNAQPPVPQAPVAGTITQPTCNSPTGTVALTGLPASGTWTLTRSPGSVTSSGTGTGITVSNLNSGIYSFTVTNSNGCASESSSDITIIEADPGVIPKIKKKFNGGLILCINLGDSLKSYQWYLDGSILSDETLQYVTTKNRPGSYTVYTTDLNGCKNFSGSLSSSGSKTLSLYPNPSGSSFALEFDEVTESKAVVSIINSAGVKVMEVRADNMKDIAVREIPVDKLEEGIYIVKVELDNSEQYFTKLVVVK